MSNGKGRGRNPNEKPWNQGPEDEQVFNLGIGNKQPTTVRRVPTRVGRGGTRIGPFDPAPPVLLDTPKISPDDPGLFLDLEIDGRYIIREHISSGGFGHVYRGEQDSRRGGGMRAIKIIPFFGRDRQILIDLAERFQTRESLLGQDVVHPNLLPHQDAGFVTTFEVSGRTCPFGYLVTPLIPHCETLEDHLNRHLALPWPALRALFTQICGALSALHLRGVMHRDIKPANILYVGEVEGYPAGFPYLIDLGSALIESRITDQHDEVVPTTHPGASPVTNIEVGAPFTPGYAPPEAYEREKHGSTFDVFSLGCLLYFMITGGPIDNSHNHHVFMDRLVRRQIPPMRAIREDCPEILDRILWEKLLAIDPTARPADASVALREVDAILEHLVMPRTMSPPRPMTPMMRTPAAATATRLVAQSQRRKGSSTTWLIVGVATAMSLIASAMCLLVLHWIF